MLDCVRVEYCGQSANLILQKLDILGRDSKWKMMAHTYGQHYHIFMVLYVVVHMSELQRITKKIPQTFFLSHIICWKLGNSCETEKKHADALNLSRYVQQNCQDTF